MFKVVNDYSTEVVHETVAFGLFNNHKVLTGTIKAVDDALSGNINELVKSGDLSSRKKEVSKIHTLGQIKTKRVYTLGLGNDSQLSADAMRQALGRLFKRFYQDKLDEVVIDVDSFLTKKIDRDEIARLIGEAFALASYKVEHYKTTGIETERSISQVVLLTEGDEEEIKNSAHHGYIYGIGANHARTLVNTPSNLLTATDLAEYATSIAEKNGLELEILEKDDMEKMGMGALLAVNKGSVEPPKMIVLTYKGKEKWEDVIGLVGKGITFDTGGYSLKPKDGIVGMKMDMGGAAAVLGAIEIIVETKPAQNVVAVIPATDNMISGEAFKPDDVITSLSGKTIEVLNTDAEGRLALADAITYAKQLGANYLLDVATLTGGVVVALGDCTTGAMTNNEELYEELLAASHDMGEPVWLLPMFDVYKEKVRSSKMADLNNSPGREAHAIMGGAFIGEFAEGTPWVHLDIAGTATTKSAHDLGPAGATGVMARTLAWFVENKE
jgi:leucyl aminopeptidase